MAADNPVSVRRAGAVAVVTIDNPPVNAMSHAARTGLIEAMRAVGSDPSVEAIVITGGGACFVAGADIKEMSQPPREPLLTEVVETIDAIDKPLVAALNGATLGGGLEIALACDLRIASPRAALGLPETRLGLVPGAGGTQRLPRLTGLATARDLIASARIVKADEALALGIVDRVEDDVVAAAIAAAPAAVRRRLSSLPVPPASADAAAGHPGQGPAALARRPRGRAVGDAGGDRPLPRRSGRGKADLLRVARESRSAGAAACLSRRTRRRTRARRGSRRCPARLARRRCRRAARWARQSPPPSPTPAIP